MYEEKSLSDLIRLYNSKSDNSVLKKSITDSLCCLCYEMPQKQFNIDEEDAADFVIFMFPQFDSIIQNYRESYGDFHGYIYKILERKAKTFYSRKIRSALRDKSIIMAQGLSYEYGEENDLIYVASTENSYNTSRLKSLDNVLYVIMRSQTVRKRFYVYFLSFAPFLNMADVEDFCRYFKYSVKETKMLLPYLESEAMNLTSKIELLRGQRNYYFAKNLELENIYNKNIGHNDEVNLHIKKRINYNYEKKQQKNNQIFNIDLSVSNGILADLLGLSRGTVGSFCFFSKLLLEWCRDPYGGYDSNGIAIRNTIKKELLSPGWKSKLHKLVVSTSEFHPYKEFDIVKIDTHFKK